MTTQDRTFAASAHLSGIFFPIVGPAVVFAVSRRKNHFAAYHAAHAVLGDLLAKALLLVLGLASLGYSLYTLWGHYQTDWVNWSWLAFFGKMALTWLAVTVLGIINMIGALRAAHRASRGETFRAGRVDRLARSFSGLSDPSPQLI